MQSFPGCGSYGLNWSSPTEQGYWLHSASSSSKSRPLRRRGPGINTSTSPLATRNRYAPSSKIPGKKILKNKKLTNLKNSFHKNFKDKTIT